MARRKRVADGKEIDSLLTDIARGEMCGDRSATIGERLKALELLSKRNAPESIARDDLKIYVDYGGGIEDGSTSERHNDFEA